MTDQTSQLAQDSWDAVRLLTVPEIAGWARVHPKTVYRWIREGKLPAIQFGLRTYRVPEAAVAQYLRQIGYGLLEFPGRQTDRGST